MQSEATTVYPITCAFMRPKVTQVLTGRPTRRGMRSPCKARQGKAFQAAEATTLPHKRAKLTPEGIEPPTFG